MVIERLDPDGIRSAAEFTLMQAFAPLGVTALRSMPDVGNSWLGVWMQTTRARQPPATSGSGIARRARGLQSADAGVCGCMTNEAFPAIGLRLRTPRSAAVAGILFAVLLGTSYILLRLAVPADAAAGKTWSNSERRTVTFALTLVPFAGIAFLWFIGVVRDRIGDLEDRFFASVFFGSGLLFLAMTFVASAVGGALVATYSVQPTEMIESGLFRFGRDTMYRIANIYAIKMAAVFMISLGTIWVRTRTMPRPVIVGTYATALMLMISISLSLWVVLVFPLWVLLVSVYILTGNMRRPVTIAADDS